MTDQQQSNDDLNSDAHRAFYRAILTPYGWSGTNPASTDTQADDDQD